MLRSMTGFAARSGEIGPYAWSADIRSVNGRGLDLKLRIPDWLDGLELKTRKYMTTIVTRGNVSLTLRIQANQETSDTYGVNETSMEAMLTALSQVEERAMALGVSLAPSNGTDILALRGVLEPMSSSTEIAPVVDHLEKELIILMDDFASMRAAEGEALGDILHSQVDEIARLTDQARAVLPDRDAKAKTALRQQIARLMDESSDFDQGRLEQELAVLAIKTDVSEELDRLETHIASAKDLLSDGKAIGRKFDFLTQEFNREANTLCSKSQHAELTKIGLALKVVIDQMREQVQNVE